MRNLRKRSLVLLLVFALILLGAAGCTQTKVKGIREKGTSPTPTPTPTPEKAEPSVTVVDAANGKTRTMPLEEYVAAVVAGEMKADWPLNAYAAQAIIARTYTMEYITRKKSNQISADFEEAQAFKPDQVSDVIRRAVQKTRGEVAMYNGEYIRAFFHSSAAGRTTTAKAGLAFTEKEPPYIVSVKSPDELAPADIKNWTATFTDKQIAAALNKVAGVTATNITDITILEKDMTGRATKMKISHDGTSTIVEAPKFRDALDPMVLKSALIKSIKKQNGSFVFKGSGFGHGVGMSQYAALKLARDGRNPETIVKYFFKGIGIKKIY